MMKKTYIISTIVLLAIAIASCKKGFLSQEINPNTPSTATPQNILSGAQGVTATNFNTGFTTFGIWLGYFAPSGNFTISASTETYSITTASLSQFGLYTNITNYNYLVKLGAADPTMANFAAIAKIMIAFNYQELVDMYNTIPYTQAQNSGQYLFPAYDDGKTVVYPDLMLQLDAAIAMISTTAVNPGASDIIFGGNMDSWKKFANTIKLRLAVRQSNLYTVDAALKTALTAELAKTSASGYLDNTTFASANPGYLSADANGGQQSPFWKTYGFNAAGVEAGGHAQNRANSFFINFLTTLNDTLRLKRIYAPTLLKTEAVTKIPPNNVDHIVGNQFGNNNAYLTNSNTSAFGPGILISPTQPAVIVSGAEACFLVSEGLLNGLLPAAVGTAQDYYQRGITASFVALSAADANSGNKTPAVPVTAVNAATAYYNQPIDGVSWTASTDKTKAIATQKYIALFGYNIGEEYNEYRRTGFPNLLPARSQAPGALGKGAVPNRVYYPSTEATTNAINYAKLPAIDPFVSLIFWAKNVN
jgi:hypothetical protein